MSATEGPLVTAIVTFYNQARYVRPALESVLAQTYPHLEVVVVDDGSTDATPTECRAYGERVVYLRQPNGGACAARNAGCRRARGALLAFLDGDDVWEPEKVQRQVEAFRRYPASGLVAVDGVMFADDRVLGHTLYGSTARPLLESSPDPVVSGPAYELLVAGNFIYNDSQVMIPARVLQQVGGWDERFRARTGYQLFLRIAAAHPITLVKEMLTRWRYVTEGITGDLGLRGQRLEVTALPVLRDQVARGPRRYRPLVRYHLRRRLREAAQDAYYRGIRTGRLEATRHLLRLGAAGGRPHAVLPYLCALWMPGVLRSGLARARRAVRTPGQRIGAP